MQAVNWRLTFITIVFGLLFFILFTLLRLNTKLDKPKLKTSKSNILKRARTGDLIGVSYNSLRGKLVKIWTGSMWAHSGIIICTSSGEKYVMEVARYSGTDRGMRMKPLNEWLDYNDDYIVAWRQYCGQDINVAKVKEFLIQHYGVKEDMFVGRWLNSVFHRSYKSGCKRKFFCSELVSHFLHNVGILKKIRDCSSYKPWELVYGALDTNTGYNYGSTYIVANS